MRSCRLFRGFWHTYGYLDASLWSSTGDFQLVLCVPPTLGSVHRGLEEWCIKMYSKFWRQHGVQYTISSYQPCIPKSSSCLPSDSTQGSGCDTFLHKIARKNLMHASPIYVCLFINNIHAISISTLSPL